MPLDGVAARSDKTLGLARIAGCFWLECRTSACIVYWGALLSQRLATVMKHDQYEDRFAREHSDRRQLKACQS